MSVKNRPGDILQSRIPENSLEKESLQQELLQGGMLAEILSFGDSPGQCFVTADTLNNAAVYLMEESPLPEKSPLMKEGPLLEDSLLPEENSLPEAGVLMEESPLPEKSGEDPAAPDPFPRELSDGAQREAKAEQLWLAALLKEPGHVDSLFNLELFLLRSGRVTPQEAFRTLKESGTVTEREAAAFLEAECGAHPGTNRVLCQETGINADRLLQPFMEGEELRYLGIEDGVSTYRRFHTGTGEELETTDTGLVSEEESEILCGAFIPGSHCYALVYGVGDGDLDIFDYEQEETLLEKRGLGLHEGCTADRVRISVSPDGSILAVSEPEYKDRGHAHTVLLRSSTLEVLADLRMRYVCMPRRGGCLVRGKTDDAGAAGRNRESLFLAGPDGSLREIFRFEEPLAETHEIDQLPAPFLGYSYQNSGACFMLDEDFHRISLSREVFDGTKKTVFYDPERARLYTCDPEKKEDRKFEQWDLATGKKLMTYEAPVNLWNDPHAENVILPMYIAGVRREGNIWRIFMAFLSVFEGYVWHRISLPDWKEPQPAAWRRSPVSSTAERQKLRAAAKRIGERFAACRRGGDFAGACAACYEYRELPGTYATRELTEMELSLEAESRRRTFYRARPIRGLKELPLFSISEGIDCREGPGEITAICRPSRFREYPVNIAGDSRLSPGAPPDGAGAAFFRRDGTLLRQILLPGDVSYAAVRGDRVYGFCRDSDCILKDLEGGSVPLPWRDWPREECVYDLSADGRFLLYYEKRFPNRPDLPDLRIKDLETGDETIFQGFDPRALPRFLDERRVLVPQRFMKGRLGCYDMRTGQELFRLLDADCDCFDVDRDRGLIVAGAERITKDSREISWEVFDTEGKHLLSWKEDCAGIIGFLKIPRWSLIVYVVRIFVHALISSKYAIRARDYLTGQIILDQPLPGQAVPCARPDGRAVYAADSTGVLGAWALDYNYE